MGSGKSSIGRLLAKNRDKYFLDTDAIIENAEGQSILSIFEKHSESYFRMLEEKTVSWLKSSVKNAVISTGGGMLVYCQELKDVGKIIYLKVPFETILSRMNKSELEKRPLFKDEKKAKQMYDERDSIYEEKADLIVDANADMKTVLSRVISALN